MSGLAWAVFLRKNHACAGPKFINRWDDFYKPS